MPEPTIHEFRSSDGSVWKYRRYDSPAAPCGTIVALHGIQSHGGWYDSSSRQMAAMGWNVAFLDRRGSGLNEVDRGDAPRFRRLVDDVAEFLRSLPTPRVLLGISWGGKLAVALQRRHPGLCEGLVLVAPGIRPRIRTRIFRRIYIALRRMFAPNKLVSIPLNDPKLFTANIERQQFIADDPLALRQATARFLFESARLDVYLRFCRRHVKVPALVLLAGRDRIIHNRRTRRYVARFRGRTDIIEFPKAHHTLEFEPGGPIFVGELKNWLNRHF